MQISHFPPCSKSFCHQEVGSTSPDALTLFAVLLLGLLLVPATLPGQVLVGPADLLDKQYFWNIIRNSIHHSIVIIQQSVINLQVYFD